MIQVFNDKERQKIFEATMQAIHKEYGTGGSQALGDSKVEKLKRTSSGSFKIDDLIGGGYPDGRIIEIYGPESSGKTTVALHHVAEQQKNGKLAVFVDAEHALDPNYAKALGVNIEHLIVAQPDTAEDTLQIAERWIQSGICGVVVIDSVAAMIPKKELEGDIGDNHVGLIARLMSQALRKLAALAQKTGTTLVFINQVREKVGVLFGNPETTMGGRALKFYATIRIEVRPQEITKKEGQAVSRKTKVKVVKNKVAPPFREDDIEIEFGEGVSKTGEILDFGVMLGILQKSGNWYSYNEQRLGNGREAAKTFLKENSDIKEALILTIGEYMNPPELQDEEIIAVEDIPEMPEDYTGEEEGQE